MGQRRRTGSTEGTRELGQTGPRLTVDNRPAPSYNSVTEQQKNTVMGTANLKPPWKPGESGNPKGRPKGRSLAEYLINEGKKDRELLGTTAPSIQHLAQFVWDAALGQRKCHVAIQRTCLEALLQRLDPVQRETLIAAAPVNILIVTEHGRGRTNGTGASGRLLTAQPDV